MSSIHTAVNKALKFTYSDYRLLPDNGKRYEILEGELLMSPSPNTKHQIVLLNLAAILKSFVERNNLGQIFIAPYDVVLSKYDVVQPDIIFISNKNKQIIKSTHIEGVPDLVIEIISPGSAQRDRIIKRKIYALHGIKEFWLVHPEKEQVQVLRLEKGDFQRITELTREDVLTSPMFSGLEIRLVEVFLK
jgi:Uma2 family endonuclease